MQDMENGLTHEHLNIHVIMSHCCFQGKTMNYLFQFHVCYNCTDGDWSICIVSLVTTMFIDCSLLLMHVSVVCSSVMVPWMVVKSPVIMTYIVMCLCTLALYSK